MAASVRRATLLFWLQYALLSIFVGVLVDVLAEAAGVAPSTSLVVGGLGALVALLVVVASMVRCSRSTDT